MMGNSEYSANAIHKLNRYYASGLDPGNRLYMTFECEKEPLTPQTINTVIDSMGL